MTFNSKTKAVNSRVSKASSVEKMFGVNLDLVVKDDNLMKDLLASVKEIDVSGAKGNAVRKYYEFRNGKRYK